MLINEIRATESPTRSRHDNDLIARALVSVLLSVSFSTSL